MLRAVEGVFLFQYKFDPHPNATLVSGQTYSEYLSELQDRIVGIQENQHANAMYDSIWAFTLALNSLTSEELENFTPGLDNNVSEIVEGHLKALQFSGALGNVVFSDQREVVTEVDIFHVREGEAVYTGQYNPLTGNITDLLSPEIIPKDDFETVTLLASEIHFLVAYPVVIALLIFTTVILVMFIYHWNKPSIKASSPILGLLIFAGCYMLYTGTLLSSMREIIDPKLFGPMCQAEAWFTATGVQLIFSTLFMRLLRIYRIFFYKVFEMPGRIWSDRALVTLVLIPVTVTILLLILWTVLDPVSTDFIVPLSEQMNEFPRVGAICGGTYAIWASVIVFGVNGVTIVAVVFLAILTRKVHLDSFKDSKQVNLFVFSTVVCLCTWFPYALTFVQVIPIPEAGYCFHVFPYLAVPFLCKVFLFLPKIWSSRHERRTIRRRKSSRSRSSSLRAVQRNSHIRLIALSSLSSPSQTSPSVVLRLNTAAIN